MRFERQEEFRRNKNLESLLKQIDIILGPVEEEIIKGYRMPKYPVIFVVGTARTGSTLMMQWLAATRRFVYPTNLLSRFYGVPYIGAKIQQLLTDPKFNFKDEIFEFNGETDFTSDLGKTKGALAPNEFWYFWRRFIPNTRPEYVDEQSLKKIDCKKLVAELAAIEYVFDKPLALKGHILKFNIPFLSSILEKTLFIFIKRHPFYNIQSLLQARIKYFGDLKAWYGGRPKQYDLLKELDPIEQVVGQVYYTNRAIQEGLSEIDEARGLEVNYEQFCTDPRQVMDRIMEKLAQQEYRTDWDYTGPEQFQSTNQIHLSGEDCLRIVNAYKKLSGVDITPEKVWKN